MIPAPLVDVIASTPLEETFQFLIKSIPVPENFLAAVA